MTTSIRKFLDSGTLFIWLCGAGLAMSLLMIIGLLILIMINGMGYFWPKDLVEVSLRDGKVLLGEIVGREQIPTSVTPESPEGRYRLQLKIGNRDLYGLDFQWVDETEIESRSYPSDVVAIERREWGKFFGRLKTIEENGKMQEIGETSVEKRLPSILATANSLHAEIDYIQKDLIGEINHHIEDIRLELRELDMKGMGNSSQQRRLQAEAEALQSQYDRHVETLQKLYGNLEQYSLTAEDSNGQEVKIPVGQIVRVQRPNDMTKFHKLWTYFGNLWSVLSEEPREANTEGGIFPAIFGTVLMVILMSIAVVPFGVLAAVYLKEYAKQGLVVRLVRIAVNNLAGVPSIVFGVFGLGFFVYAVGGTIDTLFYAEALPNPTFGTGGILWASLTLALMTVPVVVVATEEGLSAVPKEYREGSLGLGATKIETLWKVVLPCAMPGILTGLILAISRATGEVAPLMLTGVVKLAPALPLDGFFPFLHLDRKFMHLGFHIYDVGFQSPNVEAAKPMVYVTTLILVMVVVILNLSAIHLRNHMKKKYTGSAV